MTQRIEPASEPMTDLDAARPATAPRARTAAASPPAPSVSPTPSVARAGRNGLPAMSIAMRALPDAPALLVDRAGLVVRANAQAGDLAGVADPDELIGLSLDTLLEKTGPDGERRLCRPADPDDQPVVVRAVHWRVPGTGLDAVLLTDISDLVATSEALRIERRRLDEAAAFANLGWWEFDPAAEAIVLSPSLRMLLGVGPDAERIAVSDALDLLHPDDVEPARESWDRYRRSGRPIDLEYRIANPAGGYRWMHALSSAGRPDDRGERTPSGCVMDITERRRDRDALAAERAALLDAQRIARMGSFSYDVRTTQFSRSEVLQEMYDEVGVDPGNDLLANIDSEFRPQAEELQRRLIDATIRDPVEMEVRGEVGGRVYLGRARAKHGSNHEIVAIEGTVQDVTERRQLEERLRAENERFSVAQRTARMGVWQWNTRTGECVWSTMMYELLGIPDHEPADCQRFLDLVHPDDLGWLEEAVRQLVEDRQETECEIRMTRADGEVRTFRCYTAATQLSFEGDLLVVGVAQDITEQRMAENGMRRSSQRFADLVTVAPVGIALFDSDNRLLDLNDALCDLLGYNVEDVRGRDVLMFIHPDEVPAHKRVRKAIAQSDRMNYRVPQRILLRADGEPLYCELHLRRSVQDDGRLFWLVVVQDITERRRAAELLRHQATHDDLTGLPNRSAVNEVLGQLLAGPDAAKVAVLFCDIDNFKRVNDSLGHDAGDELLVSLARRLEDGLPEGCLVGRLSGDEYVVICSDVEAVGGVSTLTSRVSALLRTAVPVHGQLVRVSASIGATMPNGSPVTGGDLLRFADAAMFEAKDRGPGRVSVASPALIASADRQMRLEGELRDALASDGLTVYFQPVVGADGSVQTAEALVRWPHPSRGMLPPDVFLPVAEQGDLLRELDRWVLRTALIEATRWPMVDGRQIGVAVNLSGLVPGDPDFVDVVANTVAEVGIAWDRVVLELVETSLVDLPSRSRAAMRELVDRGVRFAVDDFGTGYSSLSRLKDLPAQIIKVDRSFVAGVSSDPSDFAVANAVVDMARAMGRSCVAEGVETATQFHVLRGMGVDAYQGWLFSPAVPPKEFRKLLDFGSLDVPNPS